MFENKTQVKICGITSVRQAIEIAKLGVDAIGVISVQESPRYVSDIKESAIFSELEKSFPSLKKVSVVKNISIQSIVNKKVIEYKNHVIQLHGDEDIEYCKTLKKTVPSSDIWKAFRIKSQNDVELITQYEDFIDGILLDSWNKDTYGGSGIKIRTEYLQNIKFRKPWWLAGGISAEWIKIIPKYIKPNGFDVSSSVEIRPGVKDLRKIEEIINYVKN
tara:strand:- start:1730 stop:2383 length:654 start_codon:yes stop_codon:yes gene_type:complete